MSRPAEMLRQMRRILVVLSVFAGPLIPAARAAAHSMARGVVFHDQDGDGRRAAGEPGLPGVRVSNGLDVVVTDAEGHYELPIEDDTILFVIKPADWMTPVDEFRLPRFYYVHKPAGSPKLEFGGVAPTGPLPESIDFPLRPRTEPRRFRVLLFGDPQPRDQKEIDYIAHDVVERLIGADVAFGATLGDIVYDDLSLYGSLNRTIALVGVPWYNVHGNHDMNYDAADDEHADETFERVYGPATYAFDYGDVHFIVLDDVIWEPPAGENKGKYHAAFTERQLAFLRNDLAHVPAERLVVPMMHIALTEAENRVELYKLLAERAHTFSLAAHYHIQRHDFVEAADGWPGKAAHHHFIVGTVSGSWWTGPPNEAGIPHTTMRCGAPNGWSIATFDGNQYSLEFFASRRRPEEQMNIYAPEFVAADQAAQAPVLVNVFAGSKRSTVEMRLGEVGAWAPLQLSEEVDPNVLREKELEKTLGEFPWRKFPEPLKSPHLWRGMLPANPPVGTHLIHVRTTDMFGQTYHGRRIIRIVPTAP